MYNLKRNRPTIGVFPGWQTYPGTIHSFLDFVFRGIQVAARELDCNLLIGCGTGSPIGEGNGAVMPVELPVVDFVPIGPWNTDGLIAIGPLVHKADEAYFDHLNEKGFPYVFAGNQTHGPAVTVDNEGGIHQAIAHLIEHGHRQIAFISGRNLISVDSESRLRGFYTGMEQFGLPCNPDLIEHGRHNTPGGYEAAQRILQRGTPFTAVIVSNDESAVGVVQGLQDAGLSVPGDVAVIGFDDRLEARSHIPLLTSVHHPMFEMGYRSVELLLKIIHGRASLDTFITIPTHLVIRESCGCMPGVKFEKPPGIHPIQSEYHGLSSSADLLTPSLDTTVRQTVTTHTTGLASRQQILAQMVEQVYKEMQCSSRSDVEQLCHILINAYEKSLVTGNPVLFRSALYQVLERIVSARDDIYTWQNAISALREWTPVFLAKQTSVLSAKQADELLNQARIAITEMLRGQYSSKIVQESATANLITQLSSRYFSAQSENEIFALFRDFLPQLKIDGAVIAYYQGSPDDPVTWSRFKLVYPDKGTNQPEEPFLTRQFPPPGLYPENSPFQLAIFPLYNPEGILGFVALQTALLDPLGFIVRQLLAALRSVHLFQQAVEARRLAEEANYLKSRFLSVVSHELRTPLNLIFGLSNMMLEESRPINAVESIVNRKDLERVYIGAQHLESLIRDVLDLARSDVGQLNLVYDTLDLREVIEAVAAIGEPLARDKDLSFQVDIPTALPPIHGDRTRLRQVVLNLVNNAVKFTVHGGIQLSVHADHQWVTVAVSDTGLGIPVNEQNAIFDEFHQSTRTTSRGFGGLGLGLSICKRLVDMHGGTIGVQSSGIEGIGSTFYFRLPVLNEFDTASFLPEENTGSEQVLLLVKDTIGGEQLKQHLVREGFHVEVRTVHEYLDSMNWLSGALPERIIIDLGLTSERGWEILKTLKENPQTREIPVLFYALDQEEDRGAMIDLNVMSKPLSTAELAQALLPHKFSEEGENGVQTPAILVVDDDPELLNLHTRIVASLNAGYRVLQARNGQEALEMIRRERPRLVLLDLMMPEVDGFTVLETMQAEELTRSIAVIVLTGQVLTQEDMERLNTGVASVLGKGMFTSQQTLDHITAALENTRRSGSETQRIVMKAMAFIHQHFADAITRSHIADHVGLSERHLTRCFHQEVGLTPMSYLNRFRVQQAKKMLEEGKRCITDIALDVGFSNGGYFTKVFREEMGISPREYQVSQNKGGDGR